MRSVCAECAPGADLARTGATSARTRFALLEVMLVQDLMSSPVFSLLVDQPAPLANEIMLFKHIRHLPVVDAHGDVVGLVTHRDLVQYLAMAQRHDTRIAQVMTRTVWTVPPLMDAAIVGRLMLEHKYGCAPVVDDHRLVGIVTASDFMRVAVVALASPPLQLAG
jgi:CBS domain-containing protein